MIDTNGMFDGDLSVDGIIERMSLILHDDAISPGCLIFLDEIQEYPKARKTLKRGRDGFDENGLPVGEI